MSYLDKTPLTWPGDNFSPAYREKIKMIWFVNGKPGYKALLTMLPEEDRVDEASGRKLTRYVLSNWVSHLFPKEMEEPTKEIEAYTQDVAITTRKEAIDRWAEQGMKLQEMGMHYLEEHGITNARSAIVAIVEGFKMEQLSRALPLKEFAEIKRLSDGELINKILLGLKEVSEDNPEIIDITPVPEYEDYDDSSS